MIQKLKTNREREREKERGKKRYLERVIEEHEAEQQIKEYKENKECQDQRIDNEFVNIVKQSIR